MYFLEWALWRGSSLKKLNIIRCLMKWMVDLLMTEIYTQVCVEKLREIYAASHQAKLEKEIK